MYWKRLRVVAPTVVCWSISRADAGDQESGVGDQSSVVGGRWSAAGSIVLLLRTTQYFSRAAAPMRIDAVLRVESGGRHTPLSKMPMDRSTASEASSLLLVRARCSKIEIGEHALCQQSAEASACTQAGQIAPCSGRRIVLVPSGQMAAVTCGRPTPGARPSHTVRNRPRQTTGRGTRPVV